MRHRTGYTVRLPIRLVPGLKRNLFESLSASQKGVKIIIEKNGSPLDLRPFGVQLTRLDNMDHPDLTTEKERKITKATLCAIPAKIFGKQSVLMILMPKQNEALSVGRINVDQRVVENASGEEKKESTYKIHNTIIEDISFCKGV